MFESILEKIKEYDRIIIHRHKNPDGDALGSQIGLKNILKDSFPEKEVYAVGDAAGRFSFMEGSVMDIIPDSYYENALAIVLDTSASALISDERYKTAAATARIDHHIFCENICDTEVTDTSYESCCGLITELAIECGLSLGAAASKALYTGMITDSGRFRYDSVNSNTFRLASRLMEQKFDTADIFTGLYADDYKFIRLRAMFVLKIQFAEAGVAYIYTPYDEFKSYGVDSFTISRGMVNTMGEIRGVDTWVNFTETENGVLAELRSNKYNINPIAVKHGGGGHAKASGATLKDKAEAMEMLAELCALSRGN
ncbi:MAG: bifunctional oligoribonuclease/PAP phosphatase NrnA [Ruminococcaceae bacterium]|nr:bifunctional oligoribonuclease/PAP phosphatase NrnA [Oscillospiraceae bacterium]